MPSRQRICTIIIHDLTSSHDNNKLSYPQFIHAYEHQQNFDCKLRPCNPISLDEAQHKATWPSILIIKACFDSNTSFSRIENKTFSKTNKRGAIQMA